MRPEVFFRLMVYFLAIVMVIGEVKELTLKNITGREYKNEVFRLPLKIETADISVYEDGVIIPSVVDDVLGEKVIYVKSSFGPGQVHTYKIVPKEKVNFNLAVNVTKQNNSYILDNGQIAVQVPAGASGDVIPPPVERIRVGSKWIGQGRWIGAPGLKAMKCNVVDNGVVFGKVRLRYEFDLVTGVESNSNAFAEIDITVLSEKSFVILEERHLVKHGCAWEFEPTFEWKASGAVFCAHFGGLGNTKRKEELKGTLKPGQIPFQPPELLLNLIPRWNQHCKDGWFFGAVGEDRNIVGALTILASRWYWPHDNGIQCLARDSGDSLRFRCLVGRGARYWLIVVGPEYICNNIQSIAVLNGYESLDTIFNTIHIRTWEGVEGVYKGYWPLSSQINPTGGVRGWGKSCLSNAHKSVRDFGHLIQTQVLLSPDTYGSYWLFWSPENPNFFTDFMKVPIGMACNLKQHPQFKDIAEMVIQKFREDVYHSIALPSGAGNECPGYQQYALGHYLEIAKVIKENIGEDPLLWPHLKAAARFQVHISQPLGEGKRGLYPGGDTHPGYVMKDPSEFAEKFGVKEDINKFETEELENFGVIFRYMPGTPQETFFVFKSGPSRGHYHGDQLSFHYCENGQPRAVDHRCSYHPRAGQEHMHNRVAFFTEEFPYANMDGYERLIAFKKGKKIEVAIGQVESYRLRQVDPLPPEEWHREYPQVRFNSKPLRYRRTVVHIIGEIRDYFVIRDQYDSEIPINSAYCIHVYGNEAQRKDALIDFNTLQLFVVKPQHFNFKVFNWEHNNGGLEQTKGCRIEIFNSQKGEYITVLYPGSSMPEVNITANGIAIGKARIVFSGDIDENKENKYVYASLDGEELVITGSDINLMRSQGQVGLFVPDAGYPFGEIPDWLIRQRLYVPEWAPEWVKKIRSFKLD